MIHTCPYLYATPLLVLTRTLPHYLSLLVRYPIACPYLYATPLLVLTRTLPRCRSQQAVALLVAAVLAIIVVLVRWFEGL